MSLHDLCPDAKFTTSALADCNLCVQSRAVESMEASENFQIKANTGSREVVATMTVEEGSALELAIKLPLSWPLKAAEVECRRKVIVVASPLQLRIRLCTGEERSSHAYT